MGRTFVLMVLFAVLAGCITTPESQGQDASPGTGPTEKNAPDISPEGKNPSDPDKAAGANTMPVQEISRPTPEEKVRDDPGEQTRSYGKTLKDEPQLTIEEKYWKEQVDAAFEPVKCPKPPPRNFPESSYKGPMIDAHVHMRSIPDGGPGSELSGENLGTTYKIGDWVCMMDYEGTSKALAFFPVWKPIIKESIEVVKRAMDEYPGRFIPFIMPPDDDGNIEGSPTVDAKRLEEMLQVHPGLFKGYGEIGLYARPNGAPALSPDSKRLKDIYPVVREHKLAVYVHPGENQWDAFGSVLEANPDITFIFHGDYWIDCGSCNGKPDRVAEILEKHPNAFYGVDELYGDVLLLGPEVSKEKFISHFADYGPLLEKDLAKWKEFIERHPDQVLWDTDRGVGSSWSLDPEVALTLNNYTRAFIGRLDPSVQEKYAYKNAEKILQGS